MRRNIILEPIEWDTLKVLADEMGYDSRQHIVRAVLVRFIEKYPNARMKASIMTMKRVDMKQVEENYEKARSIPKLSEAEMRELAGDELYESLTVPDVTMEKMQEVAMLSENITSEEAAKLVLGERGPELPEL